MKERDWQIEGTMAYAQRMAVVLALSATSNNIAEAAKKLRIGRSTMYRLIERFKLREDVLSVDTSKGEMRREPKQKVRSTGRRDIQDTKQRVMLYEGSYYLVEE